MPWFHGSDSAYPNGMIPFIVMEKGNDMPQIIPIKDLKDTTKISELCHRSDDPVFITKNGYGDMVIMSMELYESMHKKWEVYKDIEISEEPIRQGRTKNARKALESMREKYDM